MIFRVTRRFTNPLIRIISNIDKTQNSFDRVYAKYTGQHLTGE